MSDWIRQALAYYTEIPLEAAAEGVLLRALRDAGINLLGVTCAPSRDCVRIELVVADHTGVGAAARVAGVELTGPVACFVIRGTDRVGAAADLLGELDRVGVRVKALGALAVTDGSYAGILRVHEADVDKAAEALDATPAVPILRSLEDALHTAGLGYEIHEHPVAFTAQEIAASQHVSGWEMAKVVVLRIDGRFVLAVLPANEAVDLEGLASRLGAAEVRLASEAEFGGLFPGCEIGAMPPVGSLFGLEVYADPILERDEWLSFNAGDHRRTVRMRFAHWCELARPRFVPLAEPVGAR